MMFRCSIVLLCYLFFLHHVSSLHVLTRKHHTNINQHEKAASLSQVALIDTSSRVESDSGVRGVWTCVAPDNDKSAETLRTMASLCTGLDKAIDFWKFGHDGHYPVQERVAEDKVEVKRWLCTLQGQQQPGPHAVAVTQPKLLELPLICLKQNLRGGNGEAVDLLNTVLGLGALAGKRVKWISSNDPHTLNFYKSLDIDCTCENLATIAKPVMGMTFQAKAPVAKKASWYYIDPQNLEVKRIYANMCMSKDEFATLMGQLGNVQQLNPGQLQTLLNGGGGHWVNDPAETVLLSDLVKTLAKYNGQGGPAKLKQYMGENPIKCG